MQWLIFGLAAVAAMWAKRALEYRRWPLPMMPEQDLPLEIQDMVKPISHDDGPPERWLQSVRSIRDVLLAGWSYEEGVGP